MLLARISLPERAKGIELLREKLGTEVPVATIVVRPQELEGRPDIAGLIPRWCRTQGEPVLGLNVSCACEV